MPIQFHRARQGVRNVTVESKLSDLKDIRIGSGYQDAQERGFIIFTEYQGNINNIVIGDVVEENSVVICLNSLETVQLLKKHLTNLEYKFATK